MIFTTPDLSNEYNPVPKPTKQVKMPKGINKEGKKTTEWTDIRNELKARFFKAGITSCEIRLEDCWKKNALTFAHLEKRRKLTKEDLYQVVLACTPCHQQVEALPASEMKEILEKIIAKRKVKI